MTPSTTPDEAVAPPSRSVLSWVVGLACLILIGWVVYERKDELGALWQIHQPALVLLLTLQILYLFLQSGRYRVVLEKCSGERVRFFAWLRLFVIGRFLNQFLPQAGNLYRAIELKRHFAVPLTRYLAALVSVAWIAALLNFALGAFVVALWNPELQLFGVHMTLVLAFASVGTAVAPILGARCLAQVQLNLIPLVWVHGRFSELLRITNQSFRDHHYALRILLWSLAGFVQAAIMLWVSFAALGMELGIAEAVAYYALVQVTTFVAITPGNLGIQEVAFGAVGAGMGTGTLEGVAVSALLRATGLLALIVLAVPLGGLRILRNARTERL